MSVVRQIGYSSPANRHYGWDISILETRDEMGNLVWEGFAKHYRNGQEIKTTCFCNSEEEALKELYDEIADNGGRDDV